MEELNIFLKSNEETDFAKEVENYPKEKLIDIIEGLYICDDKVDGKIPVEKYKEYRKKSAVATPLS